MEKVINGIKYVGYNADIKPRKAIQCSQILIKHKDSDNAYSWNNEDIKINKLQALTKALGKLLRIKYDIFSI